MVSSSVGSEGVNVPLFAKYEYYFAAGSFLAGVVFFCAPLFFQDNPYALFALVYGFWESITSIDFIGKAILVAYCFFGAIAVAVATAWLPRLSDDSRFKFPCADEIGLYVVESKSIKNKIGVFLYVWVVLPVQFLGIFFACGLVASMFR
ncbi:hypothetical protein [Denitromonas iodatirespirans]|uniref:Transmembrane protein n=1 Tax=Denitromonas iodatirespirans TaxID=2795389 RepID=A0A944DDK6_DENI1|nr:hypothetical protein [Denitromonas iodatirespirans]MBT0962387.1 hypothetical protein [Denitromonas iodatirespirans]